MAEAVNSLLQRTGTSGLPLFVLGASSGGAMALALPHALPRITAVCSQIMAVPNEFFSRLTGYPPARFEHMKRDQRTAWRVQQNIATLEQQGVVHSVREIEPAALTPSFFSDAIEHISAEQSRTIFDALRNASLLDASGALRDDPRTAPWREALRSNPASATLLGGALHDTLVPDESGIAEELNVAYAQHELFSGAIDDTLTWFANQIR